MRVRCLICLTVDWMLLPTCLELHSSQLGWDTYIHQACLALLLSLGSETEEAIINRPQRAESGQLLTSCSFASKVNQKSQHIGWTTTQWSVQRPLSGMLRVLMTMCMAPAVVQVRCFSR